AARPARYEAGRDRPRAGAPEQRSSDGQPQVSARPLRAAQPGRRGDQAKGGIRVAAPDTASHHTIRVARPTNTASQKKAARRLSALISRAPIERRPIGDSPPILAAG